MADDERDEAQESKAKKAKAPAIEADANMADVLNVLKEIREQMVAGRESQSRYAWLLMPIMVLLLIQAIVLITWLPT